MKVIDLSKDLSEYKTSIGLGNFDGFHLAHQELAKKVIAIAKETNTKSSMLLFKRHTRHENDSKYLTTLNDKISYLDELGIDIVFLIDFYEKTKKLSPEEFISNIIIKSCKAENIVVGKDYKFAYKAQGDIRSLLDLEGKYNFKTHLLDDVMVNSKLVSSTLIKNLLDDHNLDTANLLLGRTYSIKGEVIKGFGRGKDLGYPTANISNKDSYFLPKDGVYYTIVEYDGQKYHSMTSIGDNPTFDDLFEKVIEVYICDFDKDIYGEVLKLEFIKYLRPMYKFNSIDELIENLDNDYSEVMELSKLYKIKWECYNNKSTVTLVLGVPVQNKVIR